MRSLIISLFFVFLSSVAHADFEMWQDYEPSKEVWVATTVKVDSNMGEVYLEGLSNTWAPSMEVSKKLGHVEDYWIYASDMPQSGDFNVLLVIKFADSADLAPNKARYDEFMKEFTKKRADEGTEKARKEYPSIRTITGEYQLRRITLK